MTLLIAILDDDEFRRGRMSFLLGAIAPDAAVRCFDNAPDMIEWLENERPAVAFFSLDHDLGPTRERQGARFDPGTGRDVVDYLLQTSEMRAVVVHSSNGPAATGMLTALELQGWPAYRVVPRADDDWLDDAWLPSVRRLLSTGERPGRSLTE